MLARREVAAGQHLRRGGLGMVRRHGCGDAAEVAVARVRTGNYAGQ
ncbi:hypothetical protein I547_6928 [Mycobacterium kansasii 824]|uniref:Uncharacterized protein n=1 Tax=Mycobacterium kansasii TaxID=1768 RepID=A0A1V3X8Y3_MYCKA|nr:hypothetical protein I547_6928 [Mycobacterium kansasii 824]OOK75679.1 hypothetical protein BZL30_3211 [Mycobacterium kansasii]